MAGDHSYRITLSNNRTEKSGLQLVLSEDPHCILPTLVSRKLIMDALEIPKRLSRAFDLVRVENHRRELDEIIVDSPSEVTLLELKTTKKPLPNFPYGFFFGATENEFELGKLLGAQYRFCFVCLHPDHTAHVTMTVDELQTMIKTKRTQYQINLHSRKQEDY